MQTNQQEPLDRRVQRSRLAILTAFEALVQTTRFDQLSTQDIIKKADIARSTFYAHFSSKTDLLLKSLEGPFGVFADSAVGNHNAAHLISVLDHFWDKRAFARILLGYPTNSLISDRLALMICERLNRKCVKCGTANFHKLIAQYSAAGQLAVLRSWLMERSGTSTSALADWLGKNEITCPNSR